MDVKEIQTRLQAHGFYLGSKVDGDYGLKTSAAVIAFKTAKGLRARDFVGPITLAALRQAPSTSLVPPVLAEEPVWLRRARMEVGVREIPGPKHSARVLSYWEQAKLYFSDDETPWCAGFVGAMLEDSGIRSTRSGMARSYSGSSYFKKLNRFVLGCVVVFWRTSPSSGSGHVAFGVGQDSEGTIRCLGGNQSDSVSIANFSPSRLVGFYWPVGVPVTGAIHITDDPFTGQHSTNEA